MDKCPKIQCNESDSRSESEDEESSKEKLIELLQESHYLMNKKRENTRSCRRAKRYKMPNWRKNIKNIRFQALWVKYDTHTRPDTIEGPNP